MAKAETSQQSCTADYSRNPLRVHVEHIGRAVTEANKLEHDQEDLDCIRKGAESARLPADALARSVGATLPPQEEAASEIVQFRGAELLSAGYASPEG